MYILLQNERVLWSDYLGIVDKAQICVKSFARDSLLTAPLSLAGVLSETQRHVLANVWPDISRDRNVRKTSRSEGIQSV